MNIQIVNDHQRLNEVYALVRDEFTRMGYLNDNNPDGFVHFDGYLDNIPETTVFAALNDDGQVIGTNSLTVDGDHGIHTQYDFPKETYRERLTGRMLASSWRIATRSDYHNGARVLNEILKATVKYGIGIGVETTLATFNPHHMCKYHLGLGFEMIGYSESTIGLHNAPAVLMRLDTKNIPDRWTK